jgi:hypothetical protein
MLASTEKLKYAGFGERVFTDKDLARFFGGTPARRYGLVNKGLAKGELIRIRRGVYILQMILMRCCQSFVLSVFNCFSNICKPKL